jgi:hypothetical protein
VCGFVFLHVTAVMFEKSMDSRREPDIYKHVQVCICMHTYVHTYTYIYRSDQNNLEQILNEGVRHGIPFEW